MTELATLTRAEEDYLAQCEETISHGLQTFIEVGTALAMVRDNRLYRAEHLTFEAYCAERWGFTDRRARQLIDAAAIGRILPVANAGQAAELARVPEAERAEVWQQTVERTDGKPTAAAIRETFERTQTPAPMPEPEQGYSPNEYPHDHPPRTGEADARLDTAAPTAVSEAPTGGPTPVGAGDPLADAMATAIDQAIERAAQQKADRDALYAPREVVDAANAATHFVPAMVRIQAGCEDLLHRVADIDPERAVTDLPEGWRDRLNVARDAHAYLSRVVDALDRIGVPA